MEETEERSPAMVDHLNASRRHTSAQNESLSILRGLTEDISVSTPVKIDG